MKNQKNKKQSIHIYQQGKKTIAQLNQGKEIIHMSSAICHPDDKYDFAIGSKIAYERLMSKVVNENIESNAENKTKNSVVREVKRPAKTGEYIKALKDSEHFRYKKGDILLVTDGNLKHPWDGRAVCYLYMSYYDRVVIKNEDYIVLENYRGDKTFRPFLMPCFNGKPYGTDKGGDIGEKTSLVDILGNQLRIGDTVYIYKDGNKIKESVVCKYMRKDYISHNICINFVNGGNNSGFSIIKNQSYKDIKNKTIINEIMYFIEDEEV